MLTYLLRLMGNLAPSTRRPTRIARRIANPLSATTLADGTAWIFRGGRRRHVRRDRRGRFTR